MALFVAEALNIKRLHGMFEPLPIEVLFADSVFIGRGGGKREPRVGYGGHVDVRI